MNHIGLVALRAQIMRLSSLFYCNSIGGGIYCSIIHSHLSLQSACVYPKGFTCPSVVANRGLTIGLTTCSTSVNGKLSS